MRTVSLLGAVDLRARNRLTRRASAGPGTRGDGLSDVAGRRTTSPYLAPFIVTQPLHEDRYGFRYRLSDGHDRACTLDGPAAADGGSGGCERCHLGRKR